MTGPRWPRTCSHPIYARTLTGVYQVVRMFSPCYFHVIISIGILESKLNHVQLKGQFLYSKSCRKFKSTR